MTDLAWKHYITGRHQRLTDLWCERLNMQQRNFRKACDKRLRMLPWKEEGEAMLDLINYQRYLPDAFGFHVEGKEHGWNWPVLVLSVLEVTVTNPTVGAKLEWYHRLWWHFDATDRLFLRVYETTADDFISPLVDKDLALEHLDRQVRSAA